MAEPRGFLSYGREESPRRPVAERVRDWREVSLLPSPEQVRRQATRCMDCGIPFCHEGCPLGNLIPEWNDLTRRGRLEEARARLAATNNFPELTGRLCPAPCENSCVLGIGDAPVAIKQIELALGEEGGALAPLPSRRPSGATVAVVGSGPAGLAAAQQLTRAGHRVVVYERSDRAGGLLRYGIPEFKLEKAVLDRRLAQMAAEGTEFVLATAVGPAGAGRRSIPGEELCRRYDAVVLALGAGQARDLDVPGRELDGIHFAMEYLSAANKVASGALASSPYSARGRHVVILGGGDTGADCLGTVHREGGASVHQLEIMPEPPRARAADNPWPTWPLVLRSSAAHEEGGTRLYSVSTTGFKADGAGRLRAIELTSVSLRREGGRPVLEPVPGSERELPCDLALLALGFVGPEGGGVVAELGLSLERGAIAVADSFMTNRPGVFACGDAARGQSLVVWAIAEGRAAAASVDGYLSGRSRLRAPVMVRQPALS